MPHRSPEHSLHFVVYERRCAIYSETATLILDLRDALADDAPERTKPLLCELRRYLRGNLAFLDRAVAREVERLEALQRDPRASALGDELQDRLAILELQLARLLQSPRGLIPFHEITDVDPRLEQRIEDEARVERVQARARALVDECQAFETEARAAIASEDFPRAAKCLRRAIKIDPRRAVLRNDLGVVLSLLGKTDEAAAEYRAAIALNDQEPERRTEEWTTSYYNLGVALRKLAQGAFRGGRLELAREHLRNAGEAFNAFRELQLALPSGAKAHDRIQEAELALEEIERRVGAVINAEEAAVQTGSPRGWITAQFRSQELRVAGLVFGAARRLPLHALS